MTWELPWITSGVAELPVDTARVLAYAATEGNSGVVGPNDLKVIATGTPSANIEVAGGVLVAATRYAGVAYESYIARNDGTATQSVPSTGGVSRYDFVYAHVTDPSQVGEPGTAAPVETRVITGVSSTASIMSDVPSLNGVTGVPLARIFRGPSASIVNDSDITDIRPFLVTGLVGEIKIWTSNAAPSGWLFCDGTAVSRSTYSALFGVVGTTFGSGDGATTFNLPNLQDRFPIGKSGTKALGTTGGTATASAPDHTHTTANHQHAIAADTIPHIDASNTTIQGSGGNDRVRTLTSDGSHSHGGATGFAGAAATSGMNSNPAFSVLNPYVAIQFIIRVA